MSERSSQRWIAYLSSVRGGAGDAEIRRFLALLEEYTPWIEHDGGCRAYLELGGMRRIFGHPFALLSRIQSEIARRGLPTAAGLGANKSLSRAAADSTAGGGAFWVFPQGEKDFLGLLRVERWTETIASGKTKLALRMRELGIERVSDLAGIDPAWARRAWGEEGLVLRELARGCDPRPVTRRFPVSGETPVQPGLFPPEGADEKLMILRRLVSRLRERYGPRAARWLSDRSVRADGSDG